MHDSSVPRPAGSWPYAYHLTPYRRSFRDRAVTRFAPETSVAPLRLIIDPNTVLDEIEEQYLSFVTRGRNANLGVRRVDVSLNPDEERDNIWHPDSSTTDGWLSIRLKSGSDYRLAGGYARFDEQVTFLAERDEVGIDEARRAHLPIAMALVLDSEVDLLLTASNPLFGYGSRRNVLLCDPRDGMAFVGLQQRLGGLMAVFEGGSRKLCPPGMAAYRLADVLAPELNDAVAATSLQLSSGSPWALFVSARERLIRAIALRDQIIVASVVNRAAAPSPTSAELLELLTMNLSGLVDSLARATNILFDLGVAPHHCAFSKKTFLSRLPSQIADVAECPKLRNFLEALASIRNTIHYENLGVGEVSRGAGSTPMAFLPREVADDFVRSSRALGKDDEWLLADAPRLQHDLGLGLYPTNIALDLFEMAVTACRKILKALDSQQRMSPIGGSIVPASKRWGSPEERLLMSRLFGLQNLCVIPSSTQSS